MRTKLFAGVAFAALMIPASALAQSTGTIDFEEGSEEIVVTGSRAQNGVNGIVVPDTTKTRGVLNQEFIQRQAPGQSVNDLINQLPGVSYTNNDPFGSSGGSLNIRGFESSRISQTFDGIPLNDTGNYAIYGNQQLDPELIEQVNVNLGTTDVAGTTYTLADLKSGKPLSTLGDNAVRTVIHHYTKESGVRSLERELGSICRKVALTVVKERGVKDRGAADGSNGAVTGARSQRA